MKRDSQRQGRRPSRSAAVPRPEVRFESGVMTAYGGAGLLRAFAERLGVPAQLAQVVAPGEGREYATADYLTALLDGALLGLGRQTEIAALRDDPGARMALGLAAMPSQSSLSRFLRRCVKPVGEQVLGISQALLQRVRQPFVTATLDLDGEVISTRGHPQRSARGFNRKRKGAYSYFGVFGFLGEGRDILYADLRPGNEASMSAKLAIRLYQASRRGLPPGLRQVRLRADAAFYSQAFFERLERDGVIYCVATRCNRGVRAAVAGLRFQTVKNTRGKWALAEMQYRPASWQQARRMVVIREKLDPTDPPSKQLKLLEWPEYGYQVITTNSTWRADKVWHFYNGRCRLENILKETQIDFAGDHILSHGYGGNVLWLALSVLAYNLLNWFREKVLDQRGHRRTAGWVRRTLIEIPARLIHSGRRWVLKAWRSYPWRGLFAWATHRLAVLRL